jgi:drug/metabolite transporter (DMT)-like permease
LYFLLRASASLRFKSFCMSSHGGTNGSAWAFQNRVICGYDLPMSSATGPGSETIALEDESPALATPAAPFTPTLAIALGITVLVWGSAFGAIRVALKSFGPGEMALLRLLFASAALAIYAGVTRMRLPRVRDLPGIFLLGCVGFGFYNAALNYGEMTTLAGVTSLLIATAPIFAALLAVIFLNERLGLRGGLGMSIAFAGVVLIIAGQQGNFTITPGAAIILSAAISAAVYFVLQRPFLKNYSSIELTTYAVWAGTLLISFYSPGLYRELHGTSWKAVAVVAYLGVFPAALGYVLWNYALSKLPVSRVSSFLYLVPVVGMAGGWFMLHEMPRMLSMSGGPVAVLGVYLVNTRKRSIGPNGARSNAGDVVAVD